MIFHRLTVSCSVVLWRELILVLLPRLPCDASAHCSLCSPALLLGCFLFAAGSLSAPNAFVFYSSVLSLPSIGVLLLLYHPALRRPMPPSPCSCLTPAYSLLVLLRVLLPGLRPLSFSKAAVKRRAAARSIGGAYSYPCKPLYTLMELIVPALVLLAVA